MRRKGFLIPAMASEVLKLSESEKELDGLMQLQHVTV